MQATKSSIEMDNSIFEKFTTVLDNMGVVTSRQAINEIHNKLVWKIYNVRCNEFLQATTKLSQIRQNKGVEASTGLRDKLKVYAVEKVSGFTE